MSSDSTDDDQVLPDSLQKLELVPVSELIQPTEQQIQNPFDTGSFGDNRIDEQIKKSIFGPTCSHCSKCNGIESHTKDSVNNRLRRLHRHGNVIQCGSGIEHGIRKQVHFKHRDKVKTSMMGGRKRTILREPILKTIGRSLHHNGNDIDNCCDNIGNDADDRLNIDGTHIGHPNCTSTNSCRVLNKDQLISDHIRRMNVQGNTSITPTNNVIIDKMQNWRLHDDKSIDFRSLAIDCGNLSLEPTNTDSQLHLEKSFQVIQVGAGHVDDGQEAASNTTGTINRINVANSASCSQQVRMQQRTTDNCDVTIDELASYFETFVHIPKKMSSMAEMMYT